MTSAKIHITNPNPKSTFNEIYLQVDASIQCIQVILPFNLSTGFDLDLSFLTERPPHFCSSLKKCEGLISSQNRNCYKQRKLNISKSKIAIDPSYEGHFVYPPIESFPQGNWS
jgi:hypothetical protein